MARSQEGRTKKASQGRPSNRTRARFRFSLFCRERPAAPILPCALIFFVVHGPQAPARINPALTKFNNPAPAQKSVPRNKTDRQSQIILAALQPKVQFFMMAGASARP